MELYHLDLSPPCRAVSYTAEALNVPLKVKTVDVLAGDNLKPEFLALNPEHTIPTLVVDKDFVLWESTAIMRFLVNKYAKDDSLYPKDLRKRAIADRLLHFSSGILFPRMVQYMVPILKSAKPDPEKLKAIKEALGWLNQYLKDGPFALGNSISIVDFSLVPLISEVKAVKIGIDEFPNILKWLAKCQKTIPGCEESEKAAEKFGAIFLSKMS